MPIHDNWFELQQKICLYIENGYCISQFSNFVRSKYKYFVIFNYVLITKKSILYQISLIRSRNLKLVHTLIACVMLLLWFQTINCKVRTTLKKSQKIGNWVILRIRKWNILNLNVFYDENLRHYSIKHSSETNFLFVFL